MAFYGRLHRQDEICQQGAVWYGKALRKLSKDLTDPNHVWSTSIVLSTATLAMYEVRHPFWSICMPGSLHYFAVRLWEQALE